MKSKTQIHVGIVVAICLVVSIGSLTVIQNAQAVSLDLSDLCIGVLACSQVNNCPTTATGNMNNEGNMAGVNQVPVSNTKCVAKLTN